jgi:pilus assembly protein Flp/PilA
MRILRRYWACTSGASAVEYALILAIIGTAFAAAAVLLGGAISGSMNHAAECIEGSGSC